MLPDERLARKLHNVVYDARLRFYIHLRSDFSSINPQLVYGKLIQQIYTHQILLHARFATFLVIVQIVFLALL